MKELRCDDCGKLIAWVNEETLPADLVICPDCYEDEKYLREIIEQGENV